MKINKLNIIFAVIMMMLPLTAIAQSVSIESPNGINTVYIGSTEGVAWYSIDHNGRVTTPASLLGLKTDIADYSKLTLKDIRKDEIGVSYTINRAKKSSIDYVCTVGICTFQNEQGNSIDVEFRVSDNDIAFRYLLPKEGEAACTRILDELTEFGFCDSYDNSYISTFLSPQSAPSSGWKRTKPSYEEYYGIDQKISETTSFGYGFTFPCLFKLGNYGWMLISETGVGGQYCGSRLGEAKLAYKDIQDPENEKDDQLYYSYKIEYPMPQENNSIGSSVPYISLPGSTPWRTITIGETLSPIVETTAAIDLVEPLYETEYTYNPGKSTWSWILWQDESINPKDQKTYIDLAASMGFSYVLIDNLWDSQIGREGIKELVEYGASKGVGLFLWYNSNGCWNDTFKQTPINIMSSTTARKNEMKWLQETGIKGIKVDFFGGDKQETMNLYESILCDADNHGIMVVFHGCTIPRGWERMYPNFMGSEAVRASETLLFGQADCDMEAVSACLYPFIRNTIGSMEYGGCILNKRLDRSNSRGNIRRTTDVFQLATCILFQNPIQNFAIAPNNLDDAPKECLDFLRSVPVTWDETRLIDGYPGEYTVLARRNGDTWYIAAVNAGEKDLKLSVWDLVYGLRDICKEDNWNPAKDSDVLIYDSKKEDLIRKVPVSDIYKANVTIPQNDGTVVVFRTK